MIIVYHYNNKVESIYDVIDQKSILYIENNIIKTLLHLANSYNNRILVWCSVHQKKLLNIEGIINMFTTKNIMVSYSKKKYLPEQIGFIEDSPFIKVNTSVKYPTWFMSSEVGAIYSSVLLSFKECISNSNFDYNLNSIAKLGMPNGLFCYSDPQLLINQVDFKEKQASLFTLFKFVKQHYKLRWLFILAINYFFYENKFIFFPLLKSLCFKKRRFSSSIKLETLKKQTQNNKSKIDVIIPTIGRAAYLYDVLKDLAVQTYLPSKVIVVEQNSEVNSSTHLGYIENESWPFEIIHHFTHQTGVCNARNLALKDVSSDYVYLADDDNRFNEFLIETVLAKIHEFNLCAVSISYLQKHEKELKKQPIQWATFGAGSSIIKTEFLNHVSFNMALEFGYGEDVDFGMQLRNRGADIIYLPEIKIVHLKAPIGGFRSTYKQPWQSDEIQPKPSPTVMLNRLQNTTSYQLKGYKFILCVNYYFKQKIKNPFKYFNQFKKQWNQSVFWAVQLNNNKN